MKKLFLCNFPVPSFLEMPSVGLDISDGSIRFVELINHDCKKVLGRFGKILLPEGTVQDGEIKNKEELIKILTKIKKDNNFNFIRASIIEKNSYIFRTKIKVNKDANREEVLGSLSFKLEENVPIKPEDAVFDFDVLKEDSKNHLDVVVSVLPKKIATQFTDVFNKVGLTPLSFEVEAQAVARSVILDGNKKTFMIVDFRNTRVSISIVSDGIVQLTSTLDIGGDDLVFAIKKHMNISYEEAKKIKKEKGFSKINYDDDLFYSMMSTGAALKDEINKYLIYWHTHKDNFLKGKIKNKVEKIILCGENGALKGLDDYLSLGIGLKVQKANVWGNIFSLNDFLPQMNFSTSLEYAAAIGLAIRSDNIKLR